ncbi:serine hydrolase domain-containing protein [Maricaulaceae bacterium MS644]
MDFSPALRRRLALLLAVASAAVLAACEPPTPDTPDAPPPVSTEVTEAAPAAPQIAGFTRSGLDALDERLQALVDAGDRSGVVAVLARGGEVRHVAEAGYADIAAQTPMTADTLVRIASMSKPVTAVAAMMLIEEGVLSLDTPVSDYIPAFATARVATSTSVDDAYEIPTEPLERAITVEHLLTHTSGIGYIFDYQTNLGALYIGNDIYAGGGETFAERMETLAGMPLYFQPGERWFYSYASDVLGFIVAEAAGENLEAFMQARIFSPLGMDDTTFFPDEGQQANVATLYTHDDVGDLTAVSSAEDLTRAAPFEAGGAGLFSTANDYLRFAQMLANGGELDGTRILSAESVAAMTAPHVQADRAPQGMSDMDMGYGYGVGVTYEGPGAHPHRRVGDFGWAGYFDTEFVVSPATGMVAVILAQEQPGATTAETTGARAIFDELAYGALPRES